MICPCPDHHSSGSRLLPRDVFELRALAERQPALAPAATLQIDLIEAVRRVQGRMTTPWIEASAETLTPGSRAASRCSSSRRSPSTGTTCGCSSGRSPTCFAGTK